MGTRIIIGAALISFALTACNGQREAGEGLILAVGSYSSADSMGIRIYHFDTGSGDAAFLCGMRGISNPSFVYPSRHSGILYAVAEDEGDKAELSTIVLDVERGSMAVLSTRPTYGGAPCNIMEAPSGGWVYTSNYSGGSITEFPVGGYGMLGEGREICFQGSSIHPDRQDRPYLHAVNFTKDGGLLLANDLGSDCMHLFDAKPPVDTLTHHRIAVPPGTGPRHLCFSPDCSMLYLLGELGGNVVAFDCDGAVPTMKQSLVVDSLGAGGCADIHCSPDGRYVYASHRLRGDGISVLRVGGDGCLAKVGYVPTGRHPRNFCLTPDGRFLLVACRDGDMIQVFSRNAETGMLTDTGKAIHMPKPVCLQWVTPQRPQ